MSSDTPKDKEPMKSFLVVRSQSHTSTDSLRSLSVALSLLENNKDTQEVQPAELHYPECKGACGLYPWPLSSLENNKETYARGRTTLPRMQRSNQIEIGRAHV